MDIKTFKKNLPILKQMGTDFTHLVQEMGVFAVKLWCKDGKLDPLSELYQVLRDVRGARLNTFVQWAIASSNNTLFFKGKGDDARFGYDSQLDPKLRQFVDKGHWADYIKNTSEVKIITPEQFLKLLVTTAAGKRGETTEVPAQTREYADIAAKAVMASIEKDKRDFAIWKEERDAAEAPPPEVPVDVKDSLDDFDKALEGVAEQAA